MSNDDLKKIEAMLDEKFKNLNVEQKFVRVADAVKMFSLGEKTLKQVAYEAGAITRVHRCVLVDVQKLYNYLEVLHD